MESNNQTLSLCLLYTFPISLSSSGVGNLLEEFQTRCFWSKISVLGTKILCQKAYVCVTVCASTCHQPLINPPTLTLSLHPFLHLLQWLEAESNLSQKLTLAVDAALWLALLTPSTGFFLIVLVLSLPLLQLDTADLNLKFPINCISPRGCVLICHIMSHLQHCISNIPSITGRLRGEFKIALLQAI